MNSFGVITFQAKQATGILPGDITASEGISLDGLDIQLGSPFAADPWTAFTENRFINTAGAGLYLSQADQNILQSLLLRHDLVSVVNDDSAGTGFVDQADITPRTMTVNGSGSGPFGAIIGVQNNESQIGLAIGGSGGGFTDPLKNEAAYIWNNLAPASGVTPNANMSFFSGNVPGNPVVYGEQNFRFIDGTLADDSAAKMLMELNRSGLLILGDDFTPVAGEYFRIVKNSTDYQPMMHLKDNGQNYICAVFEGDYDQLYLRSSNDTYATMYFQGTVGTFASIGMDIPYNAFRLANLNSGPLEFAINSATYWGIAGTGNVGDLAGIGRLGVKLATYLTAPGANLEIGAGTAAAGTAPLKFNAGTNLTTPVNGVMEFDGTNLYFTVGGVRKTVTLV